MTTDRPDFSLIVQDIEGAAADALSRGEFLQAYLFVHASVEALLRLFLRASDDCTFAQLVTSYHEFLLKQPCPVNTFVDELTQFNRRRNRMVHNLWRKGYTFTNSQAEPAARAGVVMYGLLIEWLETFDSEITRIGFSYEQP